MAVPSTRAIANFSTSNPQRLDLGVAYRTYRPHLLRVLAALARQGYQPALLDGMDLIHDFFESAWPRLVETYEPNRGPFLPYLQTAFFRFARRRIVRLGKIRSQGLDPAELARLAAPAEGASRESSVDIERIQTALHALPPPEGDVLSAYLEHSSERAVAERLDLSRHQVREALARAVGTVAVSLDRPADIPPLDWAVTTEILGNGRSVTQAARYLGLARDAAAQRHTRTLQTLLGGLRRTPRRRASANLDSPMPTPISDLIRAALTSSADAELYDELERRAEEALAYLDTPAADAELRTMFDGADAERLARLFEVLARGATLALGEPVPPSEEERSRVEAFLRAADEETGAAGRAFKDLLLPVLPGRLKDFESYFGALPEAAPEAQEGLLEQPDVEAARPEAEALVSRGLTPTTLLGATEAVSRLLTRSYRYGDLSPEATVRFVREEDHIAVSPAPLTERMLVEEIEDTCRCDEATARLLLRWVVEAAEHHMHLFRRLEAEAIPLRDSEQGVQLWRSTRRFNSLTEQWAQYEPTAA